MSDYIDRQAAKLAIVEEGQRSKRYKIGEFWELNRNEAWDAIDSVPSADVVPVVRCKDCANWNRETHGCLRNPSVSPWWEDDFCNYGARMDGEQDG